MSAESVTSTTKQAVMSRDAPPAPERVIFYSPRSPEQGILVESGGEIARFHLGRIEADRPALIAALRAGVADGRYYEADPDLPPLVCRRCGLPWKSQSAFEEHVLTHNDT